MQFLNSHDIVQELLIKRQPRMVLGEPNSGKDRFLKSVQHQAYLAGTDFFELQTHDMQLSGNPDKILSTVIFRITQWMATQDIIDENQVGNLNESAISNKLEQHDLITTMIIHEMYPLLKIKQVNALFNHLRDNPKVRIVGSNIPLPQCLEKSNTYQISWIPLYTKECFQTRINEYSATRKEIALEAQEIDFIYSYCGGRPADINIICRFMQRSNNLPAIYMSLKRQQMPKQIVQSIWRNFHSTWFRSLSPDARSYIINIAKRQPQRSRSPVPSPNDWKIIRGLNIMNENNIIPSSLLHGIIETN